MGLREDKKAATRSLLSDIATELFLARGFDEVSISEVADTARVSRPTVIAYFPRKTDLVFDRQAEAFEALAAALATRGTVPPAQALVAELERLNDAGDPTFAMRERFLPFWQLVRTSEALAARARELCDELEQRLAEALHRTRTPDADLRAALLTAAGRCVYLAVVRAALRGEGVDESYPQRLRDALERADAAFATAPASRTGRPPGRAVQAAHR